MLSRKMERHGDQLTMLMVSVVLLSYDAAELFAEEMAREPKLSRPGPDDAGTLNALLPKEFFTHQDTLIERANALGRAARARDDQALVQAFGALAQTCVACHAAYLNDP
jgi:hypothetical protein